MTAYRLVKPISARIIWGATGNVISSGAIGASQAATGNVIWPSWNAVYTTGSANASVIYQVIPTATTWQTWNVVYHWNGAGIDDPETATARTRRESAEARADRLLRSMLTADQRAQYERDRAFEVVVG